GHEHNKIEPKYQYQTGSNYSNIKITSSLAVTSLYQKLFSSSKTKFFGLYILGYNEDKLLELSLKSIQFCLFAFKVKKYLVYVTSLEIENDINMIRAGKTPNDIWKNVSLYKKFCRTQLFGLEHLLTQKIISNQYTPTCIAIA
ncbi:3360_t:CDS:2, partial [Cetraspora pellucida]